MLKIAITGNIAAGKSQVEKILTDNGFLVFDTDKIAHEILNSLKEFYGYDVFTDGIIDRKKLGDLVFKNQDLMKKLENLIHPKVKERIIELFNEYKNEKFIFISVPLLYEAGFESLFDKVIFVSVDEKTQINRLMARNNLSEEEALIRINSQSSQSEKLQKADFIINNNSTIDDLSLQVKYILEKL